MSGWGGMEDSGVGVGGGGGAGRGGRGEEGEAGRQVGWCAEQPPTSSNTCVALCYCLQVNAQSMVENVSPGLGKAARPAGGGSSSSGSGSGGKKKSKLSDEEEDDKEGVALLMPPLQQQATPQGGGKGKQGDMMV